MFEYAPQASNLASKGRYGDSMLVHMNPAEVGIMNAMSGNQMTINPETGQPEAFAFLLPMLGGLLGAGAAGGLGVTSLLGTAALTGLGAGVGQTVATGSLKDGIMTGLGSFALAGLGGALAGAESAAGGAGGTSSGLGGALTPELTEAINYVDTLGAGTGFASTAASQAPTAISGGVTGLDSFIADQAAAGLNPALSSASTAPTSVFETIGGFVDPTKLDLRDVSTFKDFGNLAGVALPVGAASATVSPELYGPTYGDYEEDSGYNYIPEADPPTRRLRRMPADFAAGSQGEFRFFEDPAKEVPGEQSRNFFPQTTAQREMKYGGRPMFAEAGGLMRSFDKDKIREEGGSLPGIAGALFGVGNPQKFFGMSPEQLMLLEKKKPRRMQEGGDIVLEEETTVTQEMTTDPNMRSEPEMEQDAMVFNAGVNAIMCESDNPAQALEMFVERFGMDRLHQIICEVMEMAQEEDEIEGTLTKEDKPVAMEMGGPVDTIPASLEGKQSYLLAENEYIVPEPVVRAVGNGDPEMGAMAFDRFVDQVKATV